MAQVALADGAAVPEALGQVGVRELVLAVDDGADVVAGDDVPEAVSAKLARAQQHALLDDAQALVVGVLGAEVDERPADEQRGESKTQGPAVRGAHACPSVASAAPARGPCGRPGGPGGGIVPCGGRSCKAICPAVPSRINRYGKCGGPARLAPARRPSRRRAHGRKRLTRLRSGPWRRASTSSTSCGPGWCCRSSSAPAWKSASPSADRPRWCRVNPR